MTRLLAATGNAHKVEEIQAILGPLGFDVLSSRDVGGIPDVVEDAGTFEGNACKKALECAAAKGMPVLADDSGLEVFALDGAPGVYSSRYAGEEGNDQANVTKLLGALDGVSDRAARFVCVIAVATPEGLVGTARGDVRGRIIHERRGRNGFGYDPVFVPDGHDRTFAELSAEVKNGMSHRANGLKAACEAGLFAKLAESAT